MSTTFVAAAVAFLTLALPVFGFEVINQQTFAGDISQLVGVASILYTFYGRYRAGGINAFGLRKKTA